jgi:hypothetical protein
MAVEFIDEDLFNNQNMMHQKPHSNEPWMVRLLLGTKIVSNRKQAEVLMIVVSIIFLLITAIIFGYYVFGIGNPVQVKYNIPSQLQTQIQNAKANHS